MKLIQSILVTGASGVGKSTFLCKALEAEGSGCVLASPADELDSYSPLLDNPSYAFQAIDDGLYTPTLKDGSKPTGLADGLAWLKQRFVEVLSDAKANKAPRYAVLGLDTVSAMGSLATNATMANYSRTEPPPALSPDGAAFYTYLRMKQEELMRLARAFRGYGVHLIALSHEVETEVGPEKVASTIDGKVKVHLPAVPGAFRAALPSFFSTVLHAGVAPGSNGTRQHYVQWKPDPKRPTKTRFGDLGQDKLNNDWLMIKTAIEQAALNKGMK